VEHNNVLDYKQLNQSYNYHFLEYNNKLDNVTVY
jgi:hypothetical protein